MAQAASSSQTVSVRAPEPPKGGASLTVSSTSIRDGEKIGMDYVFTGCGGKNKSPQLSWTGAPAGTKSFAITLFDPDAPTGHGFTHWVVFDVPGKTTSLEEGAGGKDDPAGGKTGHSDFGMNSYGGPCPPKGDIPHHYVFTVYALDIEKIEGAGKGTTIATLNFMMRGHVLAKGSITGTFNH